MEPAGQYYIGENLRWPIIGIFRHGGKELCVYPRLLQSITMTGLPLAFGFAVTLASASAQEKIQSIAVTAADHTAAASASHSTLHGMGFSNVDRKLLWAAGNPTSSFAALSKFSPNSSQGFYPGKQRSGPCCSGSVGTISRALYQLPAQLLGNAIPTFLNNLGKSDMIHVADQYIGSFANNRYTVGNGGAAGWNLAAYSV